MIVEPITSLEAIETIKKMLSPRDKLLFVIGINNGLRIGDLLRLKVDDLDGKKVGECVSLIEEKTGKPNVLMVNKAVLKAFKEYKEALTPLPSDYLFQSRKGKNQPLSVEACNRMIKGWCKAIGLKGNYGTHTLRKTWGWVQHSQFGTSSEIICRRYNHSSPRITMTYLGITSRDVENVLLREI